ncbi:MAG: acetylglutamate kinase [Elusimicrobiota bacterium]|nr:acetylglutamate kinase [Elusimicrobiota bacterium]
MKSKSIVIKYGGTAIERIKTRVKLIKKIIALSKKFNVVIVHGGGKQITAALNRLKLKSKFVNGIRYTDKKVLKVVEMVLRNINKQIAYQLNYHGAKAIYISCKDYDTIIAIRIKKLGYVGKVKKVNLGLLRVLLKNNFIPVVSPVSSDGKRTTLNLNADTVATELAIALKAHKLIFLTDVPGIIDRNGKIIHKVNAREITKLIKKKIVTDGMIPKLLGCLSALKKGIKEIYITDGATGISGVRGTVIS